MSWIGNGDRTELHVKIVVQRTRMAQTEISSILYWYWHTIMQTHSGVLTVTRRLTDHHAYSFRCAHCDSKVDRSSCRLIQMCSLWLESDSSYHADSLMICGHRVRVCWRYFHWIWFKSSQNLRISLWSPLAINKTTRSVSISASHSDPHTWW